MQFIVFFRNLFAKRAAKTAPKRELQRFLDAQQHDYPIALQEIRQGRKQSHWIWYIFPQIDGLGHSYYSCYYGITNRTETMEYLAHPLLATRLREISAALLAVEGRSAKQILGDIDALKVRSSMTLFDAVAPNDIFRAILDKYYDGKEDPTTLKLLAASASIES